LDALIYSLKLAGIALAMIAIIPLMVWGGSGDWRHALHALKEYAAIIGGAFVLIGGFGLMVSCSELIDRL
jgi:hypothetical protein